MEYNFNDYPRNPEKENLENKKTEMNIAALEDMLGSTNNSDDYFNLGSYDNSYTSEDNSFDPLDKTSKISDVDIDTLRENLKVLRDEYSKLSDNSDEEMVQENESKGQEYGGRQKVLRTSKYSEDVSQILSAFISCSILSMVTATIGVGWLLNIIIQIS